MSTHELEAIMYWAIIDGLPFLTGGCTTFVTAMSHPALWPTTYFYPFGNTSAVCLTESLPPEEAASVLLLGCGDPRSILHTLGADPPTQRSSLNFTCCDIEPGIIARNLLLFTLICDGHEHDRIWNIFYHIKLDKSAFSLLVSQTKKLLEHTMDLASWGKSSYSKFLRFCSKYTLSQVHRYLELYAQAEQYGDTEHKQMFSCFARQFEAHVSTVDLIYDPALAAGPFAVKAAKVMNRHLRHYWKNGIVFRSNKAISTAIFVNPTFYHSQSSATALSGDRCSLHYGSYPLAGFHLASAFLAAPGGEITEEHLISCAQSEFQQWCGAFRSTVSSAQDCVSIHLIIGDAIALCHTLAQSTSTHAAPSYVSSWNATELILDGIDHGTMASPPTRFNVIDASNLADHVGLLNILIAAAPLLARDPMTVLCTEVLLSKGGAGTGLVQALCTDVPITGLLLGIAPSASVAHFASKSKADQLLAPSESPRYRDRISWKAACINNVLTANAEAAVASPAFSDPSSLAEILFKLYIQMFPEEMGKSLQRDKVHYNRGTFTALLALVKSRVQANWTKVMDRIFDLLHADRTLIVGSNYYQEFCCQLHLQGVESVYTLGSRREPVIRRGVFQGWDNVPPVVCLTLVVPRQSIQVLEERSAARKLGSPVFQCDILGRSTANAFHNIFSCIQITLGTVSARGNGQSHEVSIIEDPAGWSGRSPLVVSVLVPAFNLVYDPELTQVSLSLHSTKDTIQLTSVLGLRLTLFATNILDRHAVHVTMNRPNCSSPVAVSSIVSILSDECHSVDLRDGQIPKLTGRWELTPDELEKCGGLKEARVSHSQKSLCVMELAINEVLRRNIVYPFAVDGPRAKLRIARRSGWIEVVVPVRQCAPSAPVEFSDTSFVVWNRSPALWNIHRINLSSLPAIELADLDRHEAAIHANLFFALSDQECRLVRQKKCDERDLLARVKDSILQLFTAVLGPNRAQAFVLAKPGTEELEVDTVIHINAVRMDLAADTFVLDVAVLPLTDSLLNGELGSNVRGLWEQPEVATASIAMTGADEAVAWKHLLAAFTERCRTWTHTKSTCKYALLGQVPASVGMLQNPLCGCGDGADIGFDPALSSDPRWKDVAPFMTRGAISPLFLLPYLETLDERVKELLSLAVDGVCAACGKSEAKLLKCSRCKEVEYCGKSCQTGHWKEHKKVCKSK